MAKWHEKLSKYPFPELIYTVIAGIIFCFGWVHLPVEKVLTSTEIYQSYSLIISAVLGVFFFFLGRDKEGGKKHGKIDLGYFWLAVAMLAWELMAVIKLYLITNKVPVEEDLGSFLLNVANSLALLASIKHFNLLENKNNWYYKLTRWFQELKIFKSDKILFGITLLLFLSTIPFLFTIPVSDPESTLKTSDFYGIKYIQFCINLFVAIVLPVSLCILFKEREVARLNPIVIITFAVVVFYEIIGLANPEIVSSWSIFKPEGINFLYRIFLFIVFFSQSVSYRIFKQKKEKIEAAQNAVAAFLNKFNAKKEFYARREGDSLGDILHLDRNNNLEIEVDGNKITPTQEKLNCAEITKRELLGGASKIELDEHSIHASFFNEFSKRIARNEFSISVIVMILWAVARRHAPDSLAVDKHFIQLNNQFAEGYSYSDENHHPSLLKKRLTQAEPTKEVFNELLTHLYKAFDQLLTNDKTDKYQLLHEKVQIVWGNEKPVLVIPIKYDLRKLVESIHKNKYRSDPSKIAGLSTKSFVYLIQGLDNSPFDSDNGLNHTNPNGQINFNYSSEEITKIIFKKS